jgi:hypothetical protein
VLLAAFAASAQEPFVYRAESGDTLIGIGERLLVTPAQWRRLQKLNRIDDPRRIPVGREIRIPLAWMRRVPESARVVSVRGRAESAGLPLEPGALLAEGAVVSTAPDGYVTIALPDESELTLATDSQLRLAILRRLADTNSREISLVLEQGRVETRTMARKAGTTGRFEIRSRVAAAAVRGTEFRVGAEGDAARSEVLTGVVAFQGLAAAREVQLQPGFGSFVRGAVPPAEPRRLLPVPDVAGLPALQERTVVRFDLPLLPGARAWRAQVATDREFRDVLGETLTDAPALRFANLEDGDYWLRVRGVDAEGLEGLDAYHAFQLKARPEPPFPSMPNAGARLPAGPVLFGWSQPAGAVRYRIQVAGDEKFTFVLRDVDGLAGSSHTVSDLDAGEYWWRLQSIRADGDRGPFGDAQAFTLRPLPADPNPPALDEKELQFSWPALPDQTFLFQLSRDAQFSSIEVQRELNEPRIALERPAAGTYYMRVRATDRDGYVGPFTTVQRIEVPAKPARPWWLLFLLLAPLL